MSVQTIQPALRALTGLSCLLDYPCQDYLSSFAAWAKDFAYLFPGAGQELNKFQSLVGELPLSEMEELYTRTFDIVPICNLYVSAHLYGDENYERGALMHRLKERYEASSFDTEGELPDHLSVLLRFAPLFEPDELKEIVEYCLKVPVKEMVRSLEESSNPYSHVLKAVAEVLESDLIEERVND